MASEHAWEFQVDQKEVFEYLDSLREAGETNMYGATPYIQDEFWVGKREARKLLREWMKTFEERHRKE